MMVPPQTAAGPGPAVGDRLTLGRLALVALEPTAGAAAGPDPAVGDRLPLGRLALVALEPTAGAGAEAQPALAPLRVLAFASLVEGQLAPGQAVAAVGPAAVGTAVAPASASAFGQVAAIAIEPVQVAASGPGLQPGPAEAEIEASEFLPTKPSKLAPPLHQLAASSSAEPALKGGPELEYSSREVGSPCRRRLGEALLHLSPEVVCRPSPEAYFHLWPVASFHH